MSATEFVISLLPGRLGSTPTGAGLINAVNWTLFQQLRRPGETPRHIS